VAARFRFIPQPADLLRNCLGYGFSTGAYPGFAWLLQVSTSRGMEFARRVRPSVAKTQEEELGVIIYIYYYMLCIMMYYV
jgi:hypothetical protein